MPKRKPTTSVPTNYGTTTIDGVVITFLLQPDGTGIVQTPATLAGKVIVKSPTGWQYK